MALADDRLPVFDPATGPRATIAPAASVGGARDAGREAGERGLPPLLRRAAVDARSALELDVDRRRVDDARFSRLRLRCCGLFPPRPRTEIRESRPEISGDAIELQCKDGDRLRSFVRAGQGFFLVFVHRRIIDLRGRSRNSDRA